MSFWAVPMVAAKRAVQRPDKGNHHHGFGALMKRKFIRAIM